MADYLTAAEAARRLGVKPATLYAYVSRGVLSRVRAPDGRTSLFGTEEVEQLAAARAAQAALPAGTLPLERLQVIVPAMAATDPLRLQLDRPAVIAAGRNIIAGMVDCLGSSPGGNDPPQTPPGHGETVAGR